MKLKNLYTWIVFILGLIRHGMNVLFIEIKKSDKKPVISYEQFLVELRYASKIHQFSFTEHHCIRTSENMCPNTLVCYSKTGKQYWNSNFKRAAKKIGLPSSEATMITMAADLSNNYDKKVRRALLLAVGL